MDGAHADNLPRRGRNFRDDTAPQKFAHRFAGTEELPGQIRCHHRIPLVQGHLVKGSVALEPGVVHQNVDCAESHQHFGEHRLHFVLAADICADRDCFTPFCLDRVHDSLRLDGI